MEWEGAAGDLQKFIPMILLMVFLTASCMWDLRYRAIPRRAAFAGLLLSMVYLMMQLLQGEVDLLHAGICLLPGFLLIALALLANGAVGIGDGLVWLVIGGVSDPWDSMSALLLGLLLIAFWSGGLLLTGRAGRKTRLPFLPFSFGGYVLWMLMKPFW